MISDRTKSYLLPALLAAPPVVLVGAFCNSVLPSPQPVSAVVAANDPEVNAMPPRKTSEVPRTLFQVAARAH